MNVLLVSTNRCGDPVPVLPAGACIVAEAAERAGHRVRLLDLMFERHPLSAARSAVARFRPDLVGLSIRNIDNSERENPISYVAELGPLTQALREACGAPVVLGGPAVGVAPELLLRTTGADWAVTGDGDLSFPALLGAIDRGGAAAEPLPGTAKLEDGVYRAVPASEDFRPTNWTFPDFPRWVNVRAYRSGLATVPLQSKRGCPFACVYCTYPQIEGRAYRLCPPDHVAEEVVRLGRLGVRDVEFVDNVFNAPREHALDVCEALARRKPGVRLHSVDLSPAHLDAELLGAMVRAGFSGIGVTAESASDPVLEKLGKGYGADAVHRAATLLDKTDLPRLWVFLLGGPGETDATLAETLAFAEGRRTGRDSCFLSVGVRIYPGTELEAVARREGVLSTPPSQMLDPVFYLSPEIAEARFLETVEGAVARNLQFIGPGLGSLWFLPLLRRLGHCAGMTPPAWQHTRTLRRGLRLLGIR